MVVEERRSVVEAVVTLNVVKTVEIVVSLTSTVLIVGYRGKVKIVLKVVNRKVVVGRKVVVVNFGFKVVVLKCFGRKVVVVKRFGRKVVLFCKVFISVLLVVVIGFFVVVVLVLDNGFFVVVVFVDVLVKFSLLCESVWIGLPFFKSSIFFGIFSFRESL